MVVKLSYLQILWYVRFFLNTLYLKMITQFQLNIQISDHMKTMVVAPLCVTISLTDYLHHFIINISSYESSTEWCSSFINFLLKTYSKETNQVFLWTEHPVCSYPSIIYEITIRVRDNIMHTSFCSWPTAIFESSPRILVQLKFWQVLACKMGHKVVLFSERTK